MASMACRDYQSSGQIGGPQRQKMACFYELPFRHILRKIAEYQIQERQIKSKQADYRDIMQQKTRSLKGPRFDKLLEFYQNNGNNSGGSASSGSGHQSSRSNDYDFM